VAASWFRSSSTAFRRSRRRSSTTRAAETGLPRCRRRVCAIVLDDRFTRKPGGRRRSAAPLRGPPQHYALSASMTSARHGRARLRWRIERERAHETSAWREVRGWFAKRRFRGHDWITIRTNWTGGRHRGARVRLHADGVYRSPPSWKSSASSSPRWSTVSSSAIRPAVRGSAQVARTGWLSGLRAAGVARR